MHVSVQVDVIKGEKITWPRFANEDYLMATGIYRPLEDAGAYRVSLHRKRRGPNAPLIVCRQLSIVFLRRAGESQIPRH